MILGMVIRVLLHPSTIRNKERDVVKDVKYALLYLFVSFQKQFFKIFLCLQRFPAWLPECLSSTIDLKNKRIVVTNMQWVLICWCICRSSLKASITLLPLLGLCWIFGFLQFNQDTLVFSYAFVILNASQVTSYKKLYFSHRNNAGQIRL